MSSWQRPTPELRASDAERERVVDFLRENALTGRINHDELDERIGLAYAAVTRGDLERLLVDLPRGARTPAPAPRPRHVAPARRRQASPAMILVGLAAIAIPLIVMASVAVALIAAVFAISVAIGPFVVVALIIAAAMKRRRPPGPPSWHRAHYG